MLISEAERKSLAKRTDSYHEQLLSPEGHELYSYLTEERGITHESVLKFKLGAVIEPEEADGQARGMICIPYLTPTGTVALRFRKNPHVESGPKYWQPAGSNITIYNTAAVLEADRILTICEGEMDAIIACQAGFHAIGIPGASAWRSHYRPIFHGFDRVIICVDNDDKGAGQEFAKKVADCVPGPAVFLFPEGHDVNSLYLAEGPKALRDFLSLEEQ